MCSGMTFLLHYGNSKLVEFSLLMYLTSLVNQIDALGLDGDNS